MIDPSKISRWFDAHAAALALYARQWLDSAEAQDVVHDVFVRLMCQRNAPDDARAWLFRCVRNGAISIARSNRRRRKREEAAGPMRGGAFAPSLDGSLDSADAEWALETLPQDQREIVVLRIWAQMSFAQIAELLSVPLSSVYDRYRTALRSMRKILEPEPCENLKT